MHESLWCEVAVIGAGIAGLVLAHRLQRRGVDVRLFECSDRVGGTIGTQCWEGCTIEAGPFSVMPRSDEFAGLIGELGLNPKPGTPAGRTGRFVFTHGRLRRVPHGPLALLTTDLLTWAAKAALIRSVLRSPPPDTDPKSVTLHEFASRRLGPRAAECIVGPAALGIYGAPATDLLLDSCVPRIAKADRQARSLVGVLRKLKAERHLNGKAKPTERPAWAKSLITFPNGLSALPAALSRSLGDRLHLQSPASRLRRNHDGLAFETLNAAIHAKRLVVATGPRAAAAILRPICPEIADQTDRIRFASLAVVHLLFDQADLPDRPRGFGLLVRPNEPNMDPLLGVQIPGDIFPDQVPLGRVLLRAIVRDGSTANDKDLVQATLAAIGRTMTVNVASPVAANVIRWPDALPIYDVDHARAAERIQQQISVEPGIQLLTTLHGGLGINDRIVAAERIAGAMLKDSGSRSLRS
ncbi:MAG: protoporphyrinogen oxidase [Planctomycetota bacterium]